MNLHELPLEHPLLTDRNIAIKLVGVGGAGANAVDRLKMENLDRLQLAVINTDFQALASSPVQEKVLIGLAVTRGLSTGGDPELGREAAVADREKIVAVVKDCDLVFLFGGLGGGTGSGALPVVAEVAAEQGALVIAFVTMPFSYEGGRRLKQAEEALAALRRTADAVIPLPNDMLLQESGEREQMLASFGRADEWMGRGVKSIWAMLFKTGLINIDFTTLRTAFQQRGGKTLFGLGEGSGETAAASAIASLRQCPLLHTPDGSKKADRLLVNIIGGTDLTLPQVNEIMLAVTGQFGRESHVIMGAVIDEGMKDRVEVCVIGTCDMGGRALPPRRLPAGRSKAPFPPRVENHGQHESASVPVSATTAEPTRAPELRSPANTTTTSGAATAAALHAAQVAQDEINFGELESRGGFEKSDRYLFDGQDLDVPTYLRKGIKISV